ncbi:hypothetical protein QJS10_CPB20g00913 [Acorus calamus]|uniref:Uncharacterized protein n=1 Tax=Acorus calamus TaxID=4465 RepID=A0AAV9CAR2_ACOCL|nr:hypothetical protein QJS10_CPB20g00913 [Acorus calamus]
MDEIFKEVGKLVKWGENNALNMEFKSPGREEYGTLVNEYDMLNMFNMHQSSPHIDIFITVEHNVHPTPNDTGLENEEMFGEESDEGFDDPMEAFYNFFDKEGENGSTWHWFMECLHEAFSDVNGYKKVYAMAIIPLPDKTMWDIEDLNYVPLRQSRPPPGRPRKKGIRPQDEVSSQSKVERIHIFFHSSTTRRPPERLRRPDGRARGTGRAIQGSEVQEQHPHMHKGRGHGRGDDDIVAIGRGATGKGPTSIGVADRGDVGAKLLAKELLVELECFHTMQVTQH